MYRHNIRLTRIFNIDPNIIQIYNNKNIKIFYKKFIDIVLKYSQSIKKTKKYNLIFKIIIFDPKSYFSFFTFINL